MLFVRRIGVRRKWIFYIICLFVIFSYLGHLKHSSQVSNKVDDGVGIRQISDNAEPAKVSNKVDDGVGIRQISDNAEPAKGKPQNVSKPTTPPCIEYNRAARMKRSVWLDVTKTRDRYSGGPHSVTMVTQMSDDRLNKLHMMMRHWEGSISVAIYTKRENLMNTITKLERRSNVQVHMVTAEGPFYPVNVLRNVALNATMTQFVFLNDIDFLPPPGSYERALAHATRLDKKRVLVVPAFEEIQESSRLSSNFPEQKKDLIELIEKKAVYPFHTFVFEPGQAPTNSNMWMNSTQPYQVKWHRWYEPYVIGHFDEMPQYNEDLVGRYENKALHITEIRARGFQFTVIPDVFLLHLWHPIIPLNRTTYKCSVAISWPYTRYLEKKYSVDLLTVEVKTQKKKSP